MLLSVLFGVLVNAGMRIAAFPAGPGELSLILTRLSQN
jgi:hypothetical protein